MPIDKTIEARTKKYRSKGKFILVEIKSGEPLDCIEALKLSNGSYAAAINEALVYHVKENGLKQTQDLKLDGLKSKKTSVLIREGEPLNALEDLAGEYGTYSESINRSIVFFGKKTLEPKFIEAFKLIEGEKNEKQSRPKKRV